MKLFFFLFFLSLLVASLAVIFKLYFLHWLLRIPRIGYRLYTHAGGANIPPYFDAAIFSPAQQNQWKGQADVFAAVPAKSGTTWMMTTLHHIRAKGNPAPFRDIYEEVRWAEFVYYPGQTMKERVQVLNQTRDRYPFAIYKSHLNPKDLHYRADAKYIVCVRNSIDVAASLFPFLRHHDPGFSRMWGGFPNQAGLEEQPEDIKIYERELLDNMGDGRAMMDTISLDTLAGFWPLRKEKNVLLIHYNDRLKNDHAVVTKIAKFLNLELTPEEIDQVVFKTSFPEMKKEMEKFNLRHLFDDYQKAGIVPMDVKGVVNEMVSVGSKRSGVQELSPAFVQRIHNHVTQRFGAEIAHWIDFGGEVPDVEMPPVTQPTKTSK